GDEGQAGVAQRIFASAKEGLGSRRSARRLNEAGIPSPKGTTWSPPVVARILKNPVYRGERYGVKKAQPAIVSAQLWNAAQRRAARLGAPESVTRKAERGQEQEGN